MGRDSSTPPRLLGAAALRKTPSKFISAVPQTVNHYGLIPVVTDNFVSNLKSRLWRDFFSALHDKGLEAES
jgi:hypothetical protein